MARKRINDLPSALSVQDNMHLETDIAGLTSNKITIDQLTDKLSSSGSSSAGWLSGGEVTDNLNSTIDIAAGYGLFRITADNDAEIKKLSWFYTPSIILIDKAKSYVCVNYSAGTPAVIASSTEPNNLDSILLYTIYRDGFNLYITDNKQVAQDATGLMQDRQREVSAERLEDSGLILSESLRYMALSAGTVYFSSERTPVEAIDTSATDTFISLYKDGSGGFNLTTGLTQWDNTHYDNGTGTLAPIDAGYYAVHSFYIAANNSLIMAYASEQFSAIAEALLANKPLTLPDIDMLLVGRVVFLGGASSSVYVQKAFNPTLTHQATSNHSELSHLDYDAAGHEGFQRQTIESVVDPSVTDDSYENGSTWLNTASSRLFRLMDNAAGAAKWIDVSTNSNMYCGHVSGGELTINATNTLFDMSAGKGYIVDNGDPDNRVIKVIEWEAKIGVSATYITDAAGTFVGINDAGNVVQQIEDFKPTEVNTLRNAIRLGRLGHFDRATITQTFNYPYHFLSCDLDYACCTILKGTISGTGGIISNNDANLKLDFSEWLSRRIGANYDADRNAPNIPIVPTTATFNFFRSYRSATNSTTLSASTTDLDPTQYDDGSGALQALNINEYTIQEVILFPNNTLYTAFIMYGQEKYDTVSQAEEALFSYRAEVYSDILGGSSRALIMIKSTATDLDAEIAAGRCIIKEITSEGGVVGGGINYWTKVGTQLQPKIITDDVYTEGNVIADDVYITDLNTSIVESSLDSAALCGFVDITDSSLAFNATTRTLTISPIATDFVVYEGGKKYVKTSEDIIISANEGLHIIYYMNGVLTEMYPYNDDAYKEIIINHATICYICWDSTNLQHILFEERHGLVQDGATHWYLHTTRGAQYLSGYALGDFVIGNGSLDSHAQFTIESGKMADEDLVTTSDQNLSTIGTRIMYQGSSPATWRWQYNTGFNVLTAGTGRLAWDNGGALTEVTNLDYVLYHIYAWNDYSKEPVLLVGQNEYSTLKAARLGATTEISSINDSGLPTPEMFPVATVIFQTSNNYSNAVKAKVIIPDPDFPSQYYVNWTDQELNASSAAASHSALSNLTVDDHLQYLLSLGRSGGQTIIGGTDASDDLELQTTSNATKGNYVFSELEDGLVESKSGIVTGNTTIATLLELTMGNATAGIKYNITFAGETGNGIFEWDHEFSEFTMLSNLWLSNTDPTLFLHDENAFIRKVTATSNTTVQSAASASVVIDSNDNSSSSKFQVLHDDQDPASAEQLFAVDEAGTTYVGIEDGADEGRIVVYAQGGTSSEGGEIQLHFSPNYDGTYEHYRIDAYQDDLRFGREGSTHVTFKNNGDVYLREGVAFRISDVSGSLYIDSNDDIVNIINKNNSSGTAYFRVTNASSTLFSIDEDGNSYLDGCLSVSGSKSLTKNYGYLDSSGNTGTGSGTNNYAITATHRIAASEFNATSDIRVKNIVDRICGAEAVSIIKNLKPTRYTYKDEVMRGSLEHVGFIAQESELFVQSSTSRRSNYIPSIYSLAISTSYNELKKELTISLDKEHDLIVDDSVMIKFEANDEKTFSVKSVLSATSFVVESDKSIADLFVFGKKVDDFRDLNYNSLFTINVAATKELIDKVELLEAKVLELQNLMC